MNLGTAYMRRGNWARHIETRIHGLLDERPDGLAGEDGPLGEGGEQNNGI